MVRFLWLDGCVGLWTVSVGKKVFSVLVASTSETGMPDSAPLIFSRILSETKQEEASHS